MKNALLNTMEEEGVADLTVSLQNPSSVLNCSFVKGV